MDGVKGCVNGGSDGYAHRLLRSLRLGTETLYHERTPVAGDLHSLYISIEK
jgi:hypothetical protein